jgi:hypothetical protein
MVGSARYLGRMKRWPLVFALALLAFPPSAAAGPRLWLEQAARQAAAHLSDGTVPTSFRYVAPHSRFPRVVLTGSFVCNDCSRPTDTTPAPSGTVAELRFDGLTHLSRDFALCKARVQCDASLCSFGRCTRAQDTLDAAFAALDERLKGIPGDPDPFTRQAGTFVCHIHYPVREMRYVIGSCTTALRFLGPRAAEVSLTERWRPREYEHGRWVRLATQSHTWRLRESEGGWEITIRSSGAPPPQLPKAVSR